MRKASGTLVLCGVVALAAALSWFAFGGRERGTAARREATNGTRAGAQTEALDGTRGTAPPGADATRRAAQAGEDAGAAASPALDAAPEGAGITGRVLDPERRPLAGATVLAANAREWGWEPLDMERGIEATLVSGATDAAGRFALRGLDPGSTRVAVRTEAFAPLDREGVVVPDSGTLALGDFVLAHGLVLEGRVVDERGDGVAGARVGHDVEGRGWFGGGRSTGVVPLAETDVLGAFRTRPLLPGAWTLRVDSDAHPTAWFEGAAYSHGTSGGHVLALERAWRITGRLVVPGVEDLSSYSVSAKVAEEADGVDAWRYEQRFVTTLCASDGTFAFERLRAVDAATVYELSGRRVTGKVVRNVGEGVRAPVGTEGVRLVGEALAALTFELRSASDDAPIDDARITLAVQGNNTVDLSGRGSVVAVGPGRYRVPDIEEASKAARFGLRISKEGSRRCLVSGLGLTPGKESALGIVRLEPEALQEVRVVDALTGAPIGGASLRSEPARKTYPSAMEERAVVHYDASDEDTSGPDGIGRLAVVVDARTWIRAEHDAYAVALVPVEPGPSSAALEIALHRGAELRVRVVDGVGAPVVGDHVNITPVDGSASDFQVHSFSRSDTTDAEGRVVFERLPSGPTQVGRAEGVEGSRVMIDLEEQGVHELTLRAPSRVSALVLVRESGVPLVGAEVSLDERQAVRTDSDGQARFEGVRVGPNQVVVSHGTRALTSWLPVDVTASGPVVIDLARCSVGGRVLAAEGTPAQGARVFVLYAGSATDDSLGMLFGGGEGLSHWGIAATQTDAHGTYAFEGLPGGVEHVVAALLEGSELLLSESFTTRPESRVTLVDLVARPAGALAARVEGKEPAVRVARVELELLRPEGAVSHRRSAGVGKDGTATIEHLPPGRWRVQLVHRFFEVTLLDEVEVEVRAGETSRVTLRAGP